MCETTLPMRENPEMMYMTCATPTLEKKIMVIPVAFCVLPFLRVYVSCIQVRLYPLLCFRRHDFISIGYERKSACRVRMLRSRTNVRVCLLYFGGTEWDVSHVT